MIKISLYTGTACLKSIYVSGDLKSDLMGKIDEYWQKHKSFPVTVYEPSDLDEEEREDYLGINGGEFYIQGVAEVEEVSEEEGYAKIFGASYSGLRNEIYVYIKETDQQIFSITEDGDEEGIEVSYYLDENKEVNFSKIFSDYKEALEYHVV